MKPSVVPGLALIRKLIVDVPVTQGTWPFEMLTAIATAKKLGVSYFELDVTDGTAEEAEPEVKGLQFLSISDFLQMVHGQQPDTWLQQPAPAIAATQTVKVLRVWAVVAIDARQSTAMGVPG